MYVLIEDDELLRNTMIFVIKSAILQKKEFYSEPIK